MRESFLQATADMEASLTRLAEHRRDVLICSEENKKKGFRELSDAQGEDAALARALIKIIESQRQQIAALNERLSAVEAEFAPPRLLLDKDFKP